MSKHDTISTSSALVPIRGSGVRFFFTKFKLSFFTGRLKDTIIIAAQYRVIVVTHS